MTEYKTPMRILIEGNERLHRRVQAAEKLLIRLTPLELCGSHTMEYDLVKEWLKEFWTDGE